MQGVSKQTGTYGPTQFANAPDQDQIDANRLAETRRSRPGGLWRSRLLWPGVLLKSEKLLRTECFVVNLSRRLDQVLQVSPEKRGCLGHWFAVAIRAFLPGQEIAQRDELAM
jgi:hypothetical protein